MEKMKEKEIPEVIEKNSIGIVEGGSIELALTRQFASLPRSLCVFIQKQRWM